MTTLLSIRNDRSQRTPILFEYQTPLIDIYILTRMDISILLRQTILSIVQLMEQKVGQCRFVRARSMRNNPWNRADVGLSYLPSSSSELHRLKVGTSKITSKICCYYYLLLLLPFSLGFHHRPHPSRFKFFDADWCSNGTKLLDLFP